MSKTYSEEKISAIDAMFEAQKIAFGPIMFQAAKALRDFGILETILKNFKKGISIDDISEKTNIPKYGVQVLLEAGLSMNLVFVENDLYKITKVGYFMVNDELTKVNMDFTNDVNYKGMYYLQDSIIEKKPTGLNKVFGDWNTVYEALSELPDDFRKSWFGFDHYYSDFAFPELMKIIFDKNPQKILDVGGNTGKFSIKCAKHNSNVKITILDLPGQLNDAYKNIEKNGFQDRIDGYAINLLDDSKEFPKGANIIWMSQFLDCFSEKEILSLLRRSYNAMDKNSELFILETFWDKQKYKASTYSLHATSLYFTNIANGNSRMYHSEDMIKLVNESNLYVSEIIENIGVSHTLLKCKKK